MKNKLFKLGAILFLLIIIFFSLFFMRAKKSQTRAEVNMKGRVFKAEVES